MESHSKNNLLLLPLWISPMLLPFVSWNLVYSGISSGFMSSTNQDPCGAKIDHITLFFCVCFYTFTIETCSFNYFSTTIRCVSFFYNETFWQRSTIETHNSDDSSQFASLHKKSQGPGTDIANAGLIVIHCTSALLIHQNLSLKRPKVMAIMALCIMYIYIYINVSLRVK